jgi:Mg2+/Co2+ transporter CorB
MKYKKEMIGFIVSFLITYMAMKVWGWIGLAIAILLIYLLAERLNEIE